LAQVMEAQDFVEADATTSASWAISTQKVAKLAMETLLSALLCSSTLQRSRVR